MNTPQVGLSRSNGFSGVVALVGLWLVPLVALAMLVPLAQNEGVKSTSPNVPAVVRVGSRLESSRQAVNITFTLGRAPEADAHVSGTVTQVPVAPGAAVTSGTTLAYVDDVPIAAFVESRPLFRDLAIGASGEDVRALSSFLIEIGRLSGTAADDQFGPRIKKAVVEYQSSIHVPPDGVFRPAYVAFVPAELKVVDGVQVSVGDTVSGTWGLITGPAPPVSVSISSAASDSPLVDLDDAPLVLRAGTSQVPVATLSPSLDEMHAAYDALSAEAEKRSVSATESEQGKNSIRQFAGANLESALAVTRGVIPASALFASKLGRLCLFQSGAADRWATSGMKVLVVATAKAAKDEVGLTLVDADFIGRSIARDPSLLSSTARKQCK